MMVKEHDEIIHNQIQVVWFYCEPILDDSTRLVQRYVNV